MEDHRSKNAKKAAVLYHDTVVDVRVAEMYLTDYDVPDVMAIVEYSIKCF